MDSVVRHQNFEGSVEKPMNSEATQLSVKKPKFWAIGGGKGGVGKTLISSNFSVSLARKGHRVLAIDLDIGGSNLHTCLGVDPPEFGIGDWVTGRKKELDAIMVPTSQQNLTLISGSNDPMRITSLMGSRKEDLMHSLRSLDVDDVVIDLGAGTADLTIDFFIAADEGILSILPEPTSVENAYRFIRTAFFHKLAQANVPPGIQEVIVAATDPKNILGIRTPAELLNVIERMDPFSVHILRKHLDTMKSSVVINQVRNQMDIDVGRAICSVCKRYFGVDVRYVGYLDYDNSVWKSVRSRKPVLQEFPHSSLADRLDRLTRTLLGEEKALYP